MSNTLDERLAAIRKEVASMKRKRLAPPAPPRRMNGLDIGRAMDAANDVDPKRGWAWLDAFEEFALSLGYRYDAHAPCTCGCDVTHFADCRLVKG